MFHRALYIFAMYSALTEKSLVKITMDFPVFSSIDFTLRSSCGHFFLVWLPMKTIVPSSGTRDDFVLSIQQPHTGRCPWALLWKGFPSRSRIRTSRNCSTPCQLQRCRPSSDSSCQECYSRVPLHSLWKGSPARCCWCRTSCWFLHRSWCSWIRPCPMFRESCRTASQKPQDFLCCSHRIWWTAYILRNPEMIQERPVWVEWISQAPQSRGVSLTHLSNWGLGTVAKFTKTA